MPLTMLARCSRLARVCLISFAIAGANAASVAVARDAAFVPAVATTLAPFDFIAFCRDYFEACRADGPASVDIDEVTLNLINRINRAVNSRLRPQLDAVNRWSLNPAYGDCEDYVVTKRVELMAAGVSAGALLIGVGETNRGEAHAVLVVRSIAGDLVLDNRNNAAVKWTDSDVSIVKLSSAEDARIWYSTGLRRN